VANRPSNNQRHGSATSGPHRNKAEGCIYKLAPKLPQQSQFSPSSQANGYTNQSLQMPMQSQALHGDGKLPGNLVEVTTTEAGEIGDYYQAYGADQQLAILWQGHSTYSTEKNDATIRRVRVQHKGTSQFRAVQITYRDLGTTNSPIPKPAMSVNLPQDIATDEKITVRITTPATYRPSFLQKNKENDPRSILNDIQLWKLTGLTKGQLTNGDWCTQQGVQIQGYIKVRPPLANELLAQSGHKAICITQCGNHDQQPMFLWHKRNPKESHEDYFRRIEAYATSNSKHFSG